MNPKLTIEQRDEILKYLGAHKRIVRNGGLVVAWAGLVDFLVANTEESKEPDRTFSGEFRPETVLAELTQFNKEGNKIAHFVYTLPDLNPQSKQESKK